MKALGSTHLVMPHLEISCRTLEICKAPSLVESCSYHAAFKYQSPLFLDHKSSAVNMLGLEIACEGSSAVTTAGIRGCIAMTLHSLHNNPGT